MRPWLAIVVAAAILGGLQAYMSLRPRAAGPVEMQAERTAEGRFSLRLVASATLGPDPFALQLSEACALELLLRGQSLHRRLEPLPAGERVQLDDVRGLVAGGNEFFLEAYPQDSGSSVPLAVRLQVLRDERVVSEQTLWGEAGEPVRGTVRLELSQQVAPAELPDTEKASAVEAASETRAGQEDAR